MYRDNSGHVAFKKRHTLDLPCVPMSRRATQYLRVSLQGSVVSQAEVSMPRSRNEDDDPEHFLERQVALNLACLLVIHALLP